MQLKRHRLKLILTRLLLLPILPLLGWGPATHPLINIQALQRAQTELKKGNRQINPEIVERLSRQREAYVFGSNSADVISLYHIGSGGSKIYDYAHNYYPDHAKGIPVFGYKLINEWQKAQTGETDFVYPEREFAVACGWLSHQLADWYAHYAAIDRDGKLLINPCTDPDEEHIFPGYSNSHRIFGAYFFREILERYTKIDHAILELAHDMLILAGTDQLARENRVELFNTYYKNGYCYNLLTATSERYRGVVARIPPEEVARLRSEFNLIIRGLKAVTEIVAHKYPSLLDIFGNSLTAISQRPDYIALSVEKILKELFCKSFGEIAELARRIECRPGPTAPEITVWEPGRSGTVLFGLLRQLGEVFTPELLVPVVQDDNSLNVRLLWGLVDVRANLIKYLIRQWGAGRAWELAGKLHPDPALWGFVAELFQGRSSDLETARNQFRRLLQPVLVPDGPSGLGEDELLRRMVEKGELRFKAVPGVALDRPSPDKELNPASLRFWVNNYPVGKLPGFYELRTSWDGPKLLLRCAILQNLCQGHHYLYVDVDDVGGAPAYAWRREIYMGPFGQKESAVRTRIEFK